MKHCIVFTLAALLHGCAAPGGGFMNANMQMDAGSRPSDPETAIRSYLNGALKDPGSLTNFSVGEPVLSSCAIGIYGNFHGWRVPAQYNAKIASVVMLEPRLRTSGSTETNLRGLVTTPDFAQKLRYGDPR